MSVNLPRGSIVINGKLYSGQAGGGGMLPHVIINANTGLTITLTKGQTVVTATETSSDIYECDVTEFGTYTISDGTNTTYIDIDVVKVYETSLVVGTIELTFSDEFRGQTITATDGISTITKTAPMTGNTMTLYPNAAGNWTVSGVYSGVTYVSSPNPVVVSDLSVPVSATLQTMASVTLTLYSATGDLVTVTDESGTKTEQLSGNSKQITVSVLPSGSNVTFTSSIAKNPSDLTEYFSKTVTITSATTEVYCMPNKVIYWWGYEPADISFVRESNGGEMTKNTNSIAISQRTANSNKRAEINAPSSIDFTNYSYICAVCNGSGSRLRPTGDDGAYVGYANANNTFSESSTLITSLESIAVWKHDVSNVASKKYPCVGFYVFQTTSYVYALYME